MILEPESREKSRGSWPAGKLSKAHHAVVSAKSCDDVHATLNWSLGVAVIGPSESLTLKFAVNSFILQDFAPEASHESDTVPSGFFTASKLLITGGPKDMVVVAGGGMGSALRITESLALAMPSGATVNFVSQGCSGISGLRFRSVRPCHLIKSWLSVHAESSIERQ